MTKPEVRRYKVVFAVFEIDQSGAQITGTSVGAQVTGDLHNDDDMLKMRIEAAILAIRKGVVSSEGAIKALADEFIEKSKITT